MLEKNLSVQRVLVYKGENFNTTYTHFIYIKLVERFMETIPTRLKCIGAEKNSRDFTFVAKNLSRPDAIDSRVVCCIDFDNV